MAQYINLRTAAEQLGVSYYVLREEIKRGRLTAYKIGKFVVTTEPDLANYVAAMRIEPLPQDTTEPVPCSGYRPGMRIASDGTYYMPGKRGRRLA